MSNKYDVLKGTNERLEVQAKQRMTHHSMLHELEKDGLISPEMARHIINNNNANAQLSVGDHFTITSDPTMLPSADVEERSNKKMAKRLMDTLVKQYAPDADTAWAWMRQAHEIGWEWGNHSIGGPTASDPLGQRVTKSIATAFSNDAGVYVGVCLIGEGVWNKGDYIIAGGPPFMLTKGAGVMIHDEVTYEVIANYPTLEAAVMHAELNYEEPERDRLTMASLRNAINNVKGVL